MQIIKLYPEPQRGSGGARTLARFDIELSEHLRLYGLLLREFPDGTRRTIAPQSNGRHAATFHPTLASQITAAASAQLKGLQADDHYSAA